MKKTKRKMLSDLFPLSLISKFFFVFLNPNCIRGGGEISHATQNLVKSSRVCTIITALVMTNT